MANRRENTLPYEESITFNGVNRHFLFNTLNSIVAFCRISPPKAAELTVTLSDYLYRSIDAKGPIVPLTEEIEHLKLFLKIQETRFPQRLKVLYRINTYVNPGVPPFILQAVGEWAAKIATGELIVDLKEHAEELLVTYTLAGVPKKTVNIGALQERVKKHGLPKIVIMENDYGCELVLKIPIQN